MADNLTKNSRKADFDNEEPPQKKRKCDKVETSKSLHKKPDDAPASSKLSSEKPVATKLKTEATSLDNQNPDDTSDSSKSRSEEPAAKKLKTEATSEDNQKPDDAPGSSKPRSEEPPVKKIKREKKLKPGKNLLFCNYLRKIFPSLLHTF